MSSQSTLPTQTRPTHVQPFRGAGQTVEDKMVESLIMETFGAVGCSCDDSGEGTPSEFAIESETGAGLDCEPRATVSAAVQSELVRPQVSGRELRSLLPLARWMRSSKTMLLLISALCIGLFVSSILLAV